MTPDVFSVEIEVEILEDLMAEEDETFTLEIMSRVSSITLSQVLRKVVIIKDDDGKAIEVYISPKIADT